MGVLSNRCSRAYALMCALSHVCSHTCALTCVLSYARSIVVLSYVCFRAGANIHVLSHVCCQMRALTCAARSVPTKCMSLHDLTCVLKNSRPLDLQIS